MTAAFAISRRKGFRPAGGWLVTYADLMTNICCFFVLIISYSIQDQVKMEVIAGSIKEAFGVAEERRYAGDIRLSGTPEQRQPGNIRPSPTPTASSVTETLTARPAAGAYGYAGGFELSNADRRRLEETKAALTAAINTDPLLKGASDAITVNLTDEGMQIVLVDAAGAPMFDVASATPTPRAEALLKEVATALKPLANRLIIEGHADASGGGAYSPFDLTAARANAARRIIENAGIPADRIAGVAGRGAANPLYPEDPYAAGNRRIEITLERAAPLLPPKRSL